MQIVRVHSFHSLGAKTTKAKWHCVKGLESNCEKRLCVSLQLLKHGSKVRDVAWRCLKLSSWLRSDGGDFFTLVYISLSLLHYFCPFDLLAVISYVSELFYNSAQRSGVDLRPLVAVRGPRTLRALRASITRTAQTPSRAPLAFRASKVQAHFQLWELWKFLELRDFVEAI